MNFNLDNFLFNTPIYTKIKIEETDQNEFEKIVYSYRNINVEGYNPWRKVETTFAISRTLRYADNDFQTNGGFASVEIQCKRYNDIFRYYCLWEPESQILMKVGQFPSVADLHIGEIKQYSKLLNSEKLKEFTRAIGLAANGVGIGSFVYLRRIFEFLIDKAYEKGLAIKTVDESKFQKARMDEKIELLKSYLPSFLVDNRTMYSVLSLGIHQLDENTCLEHFDTLRVGIEIILDEQLDELKKKEKIEAAKKKLQQLKGKIGK
ncbi:short-chain dehydrogenase [Maribacter aurantiacus]|uniref:Short-chain dehydrogenase n=1 Tax=Maribacter aurantiacus TaxID=1882343 RepID=A0A5R8MBL8_9FLAO|nr:short-chain dehydrogenase [Maribacter aurantiacus]TLF46907.1 short-chain dehydrogenase [Maribacter aurantiacus]